MSDCYDYIVIGSGFGGSVSAMRLAEKGYRVLVLERGKRFRDEDFPETNNRFWKYLWLPALRAHGILQISLIKGAMVLHGVGVGGGSLGYANVLEVPTQETFATPAWNHNVKWGEVHRALPSGKLSSSITRVGVGVLLAVPLLLIFGALFAAADANFAQLINDLFDWDLNEILKHLFTTLFIAWLAGGFLHLARRCGQLQERRHGGRV